MYPGLCETARMELTSDSDQNWVSIRIRFRFEDDEGLCQSISYTSAERLGFKEHNCNKPNLRWMLPLISERRTIQDLKQSHKQDWHYASNHESVTNSKSRWPRGRKAYFRGVLPGRPQDITVLTVIINQRSLSIGQHLLLTGPPFISTLAP